MLAVDIDHLSSEIEHISLRNKSCGSVLLFQYGGACCCSSERPDLQARCPGLERIKLTPNRRPLEAVLTFSDWNAAINAVCALWELRLQGLQPLTPELPKDKMNDPVYKSQLDSRLRDTFLSHLATLQDGEAVQKCRQELETIQKELLETQRNLTQRNSCARWTQLTAAKQDSLRRIQMLAQQLSEYVSGLKSLELAILLSSSEVDGEWLNDETSLFKLGNDWTWHQMHCLMERETRRFNERLPLYAKRSEILRKIHENQVLVLIGETGSGKSTQLVQYMVDAGFIKDGFSVACTQPRRVAVVALSERVAEESKGCNRLDPAVGYLTSVAFRSQYFEKIMYVTDHTLLQLCLLGSHLRDFDCVVVDEVHERSLNTDLLLAMLKKCLVQRPELKLIIMSATADATLFSSYFRKCTVYHVVGRSFPVQFIYEPDDEEHLQDFEDRQGHPGFSRHVLQVIQKVASINSGPDEGDVLAFLTSQAEVEWACSQEVGPSAIVLPLHGRLRQDEQQLVFKSTPVNMRKIVFATNVAETSLTIPGIKFVVDCGLAKESFVDPKSGMNILKVCRIDQSAAMQRAGRAGRTQAGICYRLYSRQEYEAMASHRTPEILRVHLGIAVLKLLALGVQKIESFDFVESPNPVAISLAVKNLCQLGAVVERNGLRYVTTLGWQLAKLGGDPRLGSIIIKSTSQSLGREGLVIAGLLSCSGSIFFRAGTDDNKARSDRLKMRFCHIYGDVFTLLSVYQEWDAIAEKDRNKWCVENSINAKSMRRCRDSVREMEWCLKNELQIEISPLWSWSSFASEECNMKLRKILLFAMSTNLAVFSGHERVGYDVLSLGKQALLHPSSALLVFGCSPIWVVFGELLCTSREFLTSVTVVEPEWISEMEPCPAYDISAIKSSRMNKVVLPSLSKCLLSRLCGKSNRNLKSLTKIIQQGSNQRCILEADYERQEFHMYSPPDLMERTQEVVREAVEQEKKWMNSECVEKCLFQADAGKSSPVMLFSAGAEISQLLMQGEFASVEILNVDTEIEDRELLKIFDRCADGVAGFRRELFPVSKREKWGVVTFCSVKGAAEAVSLLNGVKVGKLSMVVRPLFTANPSSKCRTYFPAVKATLTWPRRQLKGCALVRCAMEDRDVIIRLCCGMLINGSSISCRHDRAQQNRIFIQGLNTEVTEEELRQNLERGTGCKLDDVFMLRHPACNQPTVGACEASLVQEIRRFVPSTKFQVSVREAGLRDFNTLAFVKFDENEREGAAKAIAYLQGHSLSVCKPWQTITCKETFSSLMQCSGAIYSVLKDDISDLVLALQQQNEGAELSLARIGNGGCCVKIFADSLRTAAGCKSALEKLIEGMVVVVDKGLDESALRLLFTSEGLTMMKSVELQTRTYITCDKRNQTVKIFGPTEKKMRAYNRLLRNLLQLQEKKKSYEIQLRGGERPYGLMREIVKQCGADLVKLRMLVPGACLHLDHRHHTLLVRGSREEMLKVEKKVNELSWVLRGSDCLEASTSENCAICFCDIEDKYSLVGCGHDFCRACLGDQIMSAVRHKEGFPLTCAHEACSQRLLIADFEALLTVDQQDELQKASLSAFVALSRGTYKFCTTPDCPGVYRVSEQGKLFACGACSVRLCTSCHVEFHLGLTCDQYKEFKQDPDLSLKAWRKGKQHVKCCPSCGSTIEKLDGCNHVLCTCKIHLCWLCLSSFQSSEDCYSHLQNMHGGFT